MSWRAEYMAALVEQQAKSRRNFDLIEAYTKLIDRNVALEARDAASQETRNQPITEGLAATAAPSHSSTPDPGIHTTATPSSSIPSHLRLQSDLAEVLRQKGQLENRLKATETELVKARTKIKADARIIQDLSSEKTSLSTRLRDKVEEVKGKAKLLEDVQDEMISLTLQMNISEKKSKDLARENKELVDRWMARMGKEADAMNAAHKF